MIQGQIAAGDSFRNTRPFHAAAPLAASAFAFPDLTPSGFVEEAGATSVLQGPPSTMQGASPVYTYVVTDSSSTMPPLYGYTIDYWPSEVQAQAFIESSVTYGASRAGHDITQPDGTWLCWSDSYFSGNVRVGAVTATFIATPFAGQPVDVANMELRATQTLERFMSTVTPH